MPYFTKLTNCVKYSSLSYLKTGSVPLFNFFPTFKLKIRSRYCYVLLENIYIFGNMFVTIYFLTEKGIFAHTAV